MAIDSEVDPDGKNTLTRSQYMALRDHPEPTNGSDALHDRLSPAIDGPGMSGPSSDQGTEPQRACSVCGQPLTAGQRSTCSPECRNKAFARAGKEAGAKGRATQVARRREVPANQAGVLRKTPPAPAWVGLVAGLLERGATFRTELDGLVVTMQRGA